MTCYVFTIDFHTQVHVTVKTESGVVIDTTRGKRPLSFVIGRAAEGLAEGNDSEGRADAVGLPDDVPQEETDSPSSASFAASASSTSSISSSRPGPDVAMSAKGSAGVRRFSAPTFLMLLDQVLAEWILEHCIVAQTWFDHPSGSLADKASPVLDLYLTCT